MKPIIEIRNRLLLTFVYAVIFSQVTKADIIGHWPLDGNTNDISKNQYSGTVSGEELEYVPGKHRLAAEFRGASAINCGNVPLGKTGQITVAVWVKPNRIEQPFSGFIQKQNATYSERSFWMGQHPDDGFFAWAFFVPTTEWGRQLKSSEAVLANDEWTHVAITHDGNVQKIYVNGKLDRTSVEWGFGIEDGGDNLRFGRVENTKGGRYSGLMDDIWIFDEALSEAAIASLMNRPSKPLSAK
ncbi:LamG domain-containing protein [Opitutaceae bacterium]|nr:LamG domain-containing protein [Opitutaceae bacterium]